MIDRYDSEKTFFYCDPPYLDEGDDLYRHEDAFDHKRFVDTLTETEGKWAVSYQRVPEGLQDYMIVEKGRSQFMNKQHDDETRSTEVTERLILNYDLDEAGKFEADDTQQTTLEGLNHE